MPISIRQPLSAHQQLALTHRSFSASNNERLEFLGDAVLNLSISDWLYARHPDLPEGQLSRLRAQLVRQETLHQIAQQLALGALLRLGAGEKNSGGSVRPSMLADAVEALIGAHYLDHGFDSAKAWVFALYDNLDMAALTPQQAQDAKTRLQEWAQSKKLSLPTYRILATQGAAHNLQFEVECALPTKNLSARGYGSSKRAAEQEAAENLWKALP